MLLLLEHMKAGESCQSSWPSSSPATMSIEMKEFRSAPLTHVTIQNPAGSEPPWPILMLPMICHSESPITANISGGGVRFPLSPALSQAKSPAPHISVDAQQGMQVTQEGTHLQADQAGAAERSGWSGPLLLAQAFLLQQC